MKTRLRATLLGALVLFLAQHARAGDTDQLKALEDRYAKAFVAKDLDGIMKLYVPDDSLFVFDVEPPRQHLGAADYRKDWADTFAEFKGAPLVTISDVAVTAVGPIGYGHSIQHVSGTDRNGKPIDFTVRVTDVYRKIKGAWLIVQEHVSVPVTLATGKADINSKP